MNDLISRQAAIDAINRLDIPEDMCVFEILSHIELELGTLPSAQLAQDLTKGCTDRISRAAVVDAIDGVDWYHQNQHGEMVHGANDDEHQAWYKADDIYKVIEALPPAQLAQDLPNGCTDTISRQAAIDAVKKHYKEDNVLVLKPESSQEDSLEKD